MSILRPLGLKDRQLVTAYLRRHPPKVSEMTFTNLFAWRNSRPLLIAEINDSIVFLTKIQDEKEEGMVVFGPPIGKFHPLTIINSLGEKIKGFVRIAEETATLLEDMGLQIIADEDNSDYVYRVDDLASLQGRRFHKKRNLIKQCLNNNCSYEALTPQLITECIDMQDRWCEIRECGINPGLCNEYSAIREAFSHYESLRLIGGAIRVDGIIQAYAIGEELSPGTAVCHFEKAMPGIQGLSQLINQWYAKYSLKEFTFINREQDLGIPGLRQAKKSYYPHHMVHKFNAVMAPARPESLSPVEPHECDKHTLVHLQEH